MSRGTTRVLLVLLVLSAGCSSLAPLPGEQTTTTTNTTTTTSTAIQKTEYRVTVVGVVDGDTYKVRFRSGAVENVRLLGIDTPEVHVENDPEEFEGIPTTDDGRAWLRDWGHKSSEFARTKVAGKTVTIRTDPQADRRGSYGRLLVYVYVSDGKSVNELLVEQGYARLYESQFSQRAAFASDERYAQEQRIGLWNYDGPGATGSTVSSSTGLVVSAVHADASGNDHENLGDEYVTFRNTGAAAIDMTGWQIRDDTGHTYTVPSFTLGPGDSVTLYTGRGTDTATKLYWNRDRAAWNNGGDRIVVTNSNGETVLRHEYGG